MAWLNKMLTRFDEWLETRSERLERESMTAEDRQAEAQRDAILDEECRSDVAAARNLLPEMRDFLSPEPSAFLSAEFNRIARIASSPQELRLTVGVTGVQVALMAFAVDGAAEIQSDNALRTRERFVPAAKLGDIFEDRESPAGNGLALWNLVCARARKGETSFSLSSPVTLTPQNNGAIKVALSPTAVEI
jgi:hypothetical protein